MKKAVLFFADGTEEVEALTAVDILRRAGYRRIFRPRKSVRRIMIW